MIRKANNYEFEILSDISFKSKKFWNYPEDYFNIWKNELTITKEYINKNIVYVYEENDKIIAYYSLINNKKDQYFNDVFVEKGWWLEHIFVLPDFINKGIGTKLIKHIHEISVINKIDKLKIFSDPNSNGFYDKIGAIKIRKSNSSIKDREILVYEL